LYTFDIYHNGVIGRASLSFKVTSGSRHCNPSLNFKAIKFTVHANYLNDMVFLLPKNFILNGCQLFDFERT